LRIVHLIGYFQPELGYREYYYSKYLSRLGYDVHVVTSNRIYPFKNINALHKSLGIPNTRERTLGTYNYENFTIHRLPCIFELHDLIFVKGLKKCIQRINPKIIHAYEARQGLSSLINYKRNYAFSKLYYEHEQRYIGNGILRKVDFLIRKPFILNNCINADFISVATKQAENFLVNNIKKFNHKKINYMNLGADPEIFYYVENAQIHINDEVFSNLHNRILITVGSINKRKEIHNLIKVYQEANITDPSIFIILGDGDKKYVNYLKTLSNKISIDKKKIIIINSVNKEKLKYYYSIADLGIWHKASISIIEGMATGLPVIVQNTKSVNHLVSGNNGYIYNDLGECKLKIEELMNDKNKLNNMRVNAKTHFNKYFNYFNLSKDLSAIYKSIVN
jgi:glycosyltransferase involved in cell wall biosynthesis